MFYSYFNSCIKQTYQNKFSINAKTFPFGFQEKEKEANEAAANNTKTAQGEECTIRTNPPRRTSSSGGGGHGNGAAGGGGAGGSISDACETCSQHKTNSTSREALHKASEGEHCTKKRQGEKERR